MTFCFFLSPRIGHPTGASTKEPEFDEKALLADLIEVRKAKKRKQKRQEFDEDDDEEALLMVLKLFMEH